MNENDPIPFLNQGAYDENTDQVLDIPLQHVRLSEQMVMMTTDVDSIACHSSKLEDIFDAIGGTDITICMDSIINRETFVTKSPMSVKCAARSEEGSFHPTYRGTKRNVLPLKYFPNVRLAKFQKRNISFYLSVYVLRSVDIQGTRMNRNELALICCAWNTVRQYFTLLPTWGDIEDPKIRSSLAAAFRSWAPFIVKSGPTNHQKMLKPRSNGLSGDAVAYLPWLFMDVLRNIKDCPTNWYVDYTLFMSHRNQTITSRPEEETFQQEAEFLLRDMFFSVQAVGIKAEWPTILTAIANELNKPSPILYEKVSPDNTPNLCRVMNRCIVNARRKGIYAFFRNITVRSNTRHFFTIDVGVSFTPMTQNTTFVFDGFAVNQLVKSQMQVKLNEAYPATEDGTQPEREVMQEMDYSHYDAEESIWQTNKDDSIDSDSPDEDDQWSESDIQVMDGDMSMAHGIQTTERIRGGGDFENGSEDSIDRIFQELNERDESDFEETDASEIEETVENDEGGGLSELLEIYDEEIQNHDLRSLVQEEEVEMIEVEEPLDAAFDILGAVEDRQRPNRIQYPIFGTTGLLGNAQQVKNLVQPVFEADENYTGLDWKGFVVPFIQAEGQTVITGMKTYMDASRTMFQRWTHQAVLAQLKYLAIRTSHFLKSTVQRTDIKSKMPKEMRDLLANLDSVFQSFLNDLRFHDRCSVRCEYTFMGYDRELVMPFDTVVNNELCPLSTVCQVETGGLYYASQAIYQQNVRPLIRLSNLTIETIKRVYTPSMKTALVARAEAAVHFLQCGGLVQGSIHHRILEDCTSLFWQIPTDHHVELNSGQMETSLLAFGVNPGLLSLLSDEFMRNNPRSCQIRMDASQLTSISRNAPDLIRARDQFLQILFAVVPNTRISEIGTMSTLPIDSIVQQTEGALTQVVKETAGLIFRVYQTEWNTIVRAKHPDCNLVLRKNNINDISMATNGYIYNSGDTRFNRREPDAIVGREVVDAGE